MTDDLLSGSALKSSERIPKSLDNAMDKANPFKNGVQMGISLRNGPVEEMEIDEPNGGSSKTSAVVSAKRKQRQSMTNGKSYKEASSENEEDEEPLVR